MSLEKHFATAVYLLYEHDINRKVETNIGVDFMWEGIMHIFSGTANIFVRTKGFGYFGRLLATSTRNHQLWKQ